ncbi:CoA ester lyase [Azospirillum sp. RWY-5-1]|uniref:CoA ester lyase n=1 Tax=Azospirillum oleiclasticum TaxID=2735135 RepID=A0ABX2TFJ2_9PROT|nr:CoA ester lyase [Azospirillum oleiclasticum]NYZ16143.1 CoA ester lyase [Azospirillum oleiclasticum]NYZ23023.1 CoA ester lyase [Azospirillum oleiclasticum]
MRSFLFVPGDSPRKFARARQTAADALILDLEDAVAADAKPQARLDTAAMLAEERGQQRLFVRVNAFDTGLTATDLAAVMPHAPDGIALPKCSGPEQVQRLDHMLEALEAAHGREPGSTLILAIATETAESLFGLGRYKGCSPRLWALMWGAEDLCASLGATTNRDGDRLLDSFRLARTLCLAGAAAAGVVAVDTVATTLDDLEAVAREAREARRDGFQAKMVIHPKHVDVVNAAFRPSDRDIAWATRIVEAFEAGTTGVVRLDGQMIDKPHLRAAEKILASAGLK